MRFEIITNILVIAVLVYLSFILTLADWLVALRKGQAVTLRDDHQLIQGGPYAWVRNPMYFGWWLAMLGLLFLYPTWVVLLMLLFSVIAFIGRAHREEAALSARFGEAWTEYKKRTRFLIPFIY